VARRRNLTTAISAALVLGLTACGSDADDVGAEAAGTIGVILPDTVTSSRWATADKPLLEKAFKKAGVDYDIQNAEGDAQRMATIAEQMILDGVRVLAIVNLDNESGALIQRQAAQRGVRTIDYDRLTLGGSAEYYVSFDAVEVGRLQGRGLARCLGKDAEARIAFLNGSPDDRNATLFAEGAHDVLDEQAGFVQVAEQPVPGWDVQKATTVFEQMYIQAGGDIQGVLAANDALADEVISVLRRNDAGDVQVTGQDATVEGLRNILAGDQCMTVHKPIAEEADALVGLAVAMLDGEENAMLDGEDGEPSELVTDPEGDRRVPSILLEPDSVFLEDIAQLVADDFVSADDLCAGELAETCEELGIE
jgi:D-xylose transport system substrate-binding protein